MMTPHDEEIILKWHDRIEQDIRIGLVLTEDERSPMFQAYCDHLTRLVPSIRIKRDEATDLQAPHIRVGKNIRYLALPEGNELEPFLGALAQLLGQEVPAKPADPSNLDKIRIPAWLKAYVAPHCPFCPATVRQLILLAGINQSVHLTVIDGLIFPERAALDRVQASPTVILDDQFRWTGSIRLPELIDVMVNRDPSNLGSLSLKGMLEEGNAAGVAQMMIEREKIFPAFISLLTHERWSVRLAAMVAFEAIVEKKKDLAAQVIQPLWEAFAQAEDTIKGDILYVYGESGDPRVIPKLKMIAMEARNDEVKEAAIEALEKLEHHSGC